MNDRVPSTPGWRHPLALVIIGALCGSLRAAAQSPADTGAASRDSLLIRLRRAEEALAAIRQQLDEQSASAVTTASRLRLELRGRVIVNAFSNDGRVNNVDVPQFVRSDTAALLPQAGIGLAARQTSLGLTVFADTVLGARFTGDVDVDFFGGQQPSGGGRTFPLIRLRTARATLRWSGAELLVGQEMPLVAGVNPRGVASLGTPGFAAAGNLWLWLPQVRGTLVRGGDVQLLLQGAVLAPTSGDAAAAFDTDVDLAERTRRPFLESRVGLRWGEGATAGDVGCGGHLGWLKTPTGASARSEAIACDAIVPLGARLELRGEVYTGRGLRGLGGGAISQNAGVSGAPPHTRAGWVQANARVAARSFVGAGCGVDDPRDEDLLISGRLLNTACAAHVLARESGPMFFGAEVRRLSTRYAAGDFTNLHLNLAAGFEF